MRPRTQSPLEEPTVNLTPLIDIVFVILIMFIVVAPLLEKEGVELADASPVKSEIPPNIQDKSPIAIYVLSDDTVKLGEEPLDLNQLESRLIQEKEAHPSVIPQLFQDKRAHFGTYQNVKNTVEKAGFDKLDLILNPS